MSTLKTGALRGTSGTADSVQLHASNQSVTFPGAVTIAGALTSSTTGLGKIIQIVAGTPDTSARSTTSTTFVTASSTCNVTITPSSASNKILVVAVGTFSAQDGNDGWAATIYRDSTNLGPSEAGLAYGNSVAGITALYYPTSLHVIDTAHNTTSAITYQLRVLNHDTDADGFSVRIGNTNYGPADADNTVPSVMYAMEFA